MAKYPTVVWGIHAGKTGDADQLFLRQNVIALGWDEVGDLSKLPADREAFKARVKECYPTRKEGYLLGGSVDTRLLEVRVFDKQVARTAYAKQTQAVAGKGKSNCPLCAVGHGANKARIYKFEEMDADHVAAWSKGGDTSAKNCQMLCSTHNRAKGNR